MLVVDGLHTLIRAAIYTFLSSLKMLIGGNPQRTRTVEDIILVVRPLPSLKGWIEIRQ